MMHKAVFDHSPLGILALDDSGRVLSANAAAVEIFPCLANSGMNILEALIIDDAGLSAIRESGRIRVERRLGDMMPNNLQHGCAPLDRVLDIHAVATEKGGYIIHFQDVSSSRKAEMELRRRNEELYLATQGVGLSYWERDLTTQRYSGSLFFQDEVEGDPFYSRVHKDDLLRLLCEVDAHKQGLTPHYRCEYRIRIGDEWRWYLGMGVLIDDGERRRMVGFNQDIHRRKLLEERLQSSLEEKTEMVREVHHRVNNNLQILKSLVEMRLLQVQDEMARQELMAVESRIMAMALTHRSIFGRENVASVPAEEHFRNLLQEIVEIHQMDSEPTIKVRCGDSQLRLPCAINCSLILGELTSTVLRATSCEKRVDIEVDMWQDGGLANLRFRSNRCLFSDETPDDLSMELLNRLVSTNLQGTVRTEPCTGTDWVFSFPT